MIPLQAQQPHEPTVTAKKQPNFTSWPVSVHLHNCSSLRHQSLSLSVLVSMRTVKQTCTQLSPLKAGSSYNYMNCPQCFTKLQEDWPDSSIYLSNTLKLLSYRPAKESSGRLLCFWLRLIGWFGLPHEADVTSLSERTTDYGTLCSTPFLSCLAALIIRCQV